MTAFLASLLLSVATGQAPPSTPCAVSTCGHCGQSCMRTSSCLCATAGDCGGCNLCRTCNTCACISLKGLGAASSTCGDLYNGGDDGWDVYVEHATASYDSATLYPGTVVSKITCDAGYKYVGEASYTCGGDGKWETGGSIPKCVSTSPTPAPPKPTPAPAPKYLCNTGDHTCVPASSGTSLAICNASCSCKVPDNCGIHNYTTVCSHPFEGCDVCARCCQSYIKNDDDCASCVETECKAGHKECCIGALISS
jgi:hypothetical protein